MKVTKYEPHKVQLSKTTTELSLCTPIIPPSVLYVSQSLLFELSSFFVNWLYKTSSLTCYTVQQRCSLPRVLFPPVHIQLSAYILPLPKGLPNHRCHSNLLLPLFHVLCTTPSENILLGTSCHVCCVHCFSLHKGCSVMLSSFLFYSLNFPVLKTTVAY